MFTNLLVSMKNNLSNRQQLFFRKLTAYLPELIKWITNTLGKPPGQKSLRNSSKFVNKLKDTLIRKPPEKKLSTSKTINFYSLEKRLLAQNNINASRSWSQINLKCPTQIHQKQQNSWRIQLYKNKDSSYLLISNKIFLTIFWETSPSLTTKQKHWPFEFTLLLC